MNGITCELRRATSFRAPVLWLMISLVLLSGCMVGGVATTPTEEPEPPFNEKVLESLVGSTRKEILQKLGQPMQGFLGPDESYLVYGGYIDAAGLAFIGVVPIPVWGEDFALICSMLEFGPDQRMTRFETYGQYSGWASPDHSTYIHSCEAAFWSLKEIAALGRIRNIETEKRAHAGDPNAMYQYAYELNNLSMAWEWYCLAAHNGHGKARYAVGNYYRWGRGPKSSDSVRAYLWYTLAGDTENAVQFKDQVASEMDAPQIAEAERLVAEWEPSLAECEIFSGGSDAP